jgi:membrane-associated phospholipid phosphatase
VQGWRLEFGWCTTTVLRAIVVLYAAVVGVMAATGSFFFIRKSAIIPVLCLAALLSDRLTAFVRDWAVFIGLTMVFDAGRGLAYAYIAYAGAPVWMSYVIALERGVLGGALLPVVLQQAWPDGGGVSWLDRAMLTLHASHFVFFLGAGLVIWLRRPAVFPQYRHTMLFVMYVGLAIYVLVPTVPPWMASTVYHALPPVESIALRLYNADVPTLTAALATNPIAAMPSLHAAFPLACSLIALEVFGRRAWWTLPYTLVVACAVIYLGEHYLVDVLAGWMLAGAAWWCGRSGRPARERRPQPVLAAIAIAGVLVAMAEAAGVVKTRIEPPNPQLRVDR